MTKIDSLISLAARARKLISGSDMVEMSIKKSRKVKLIIVAEDAKDSVKSLFRELSLKQNIPLLFYSTKESLGHYIGKGERSVIGITDESFADGINNAQERM